MQGYIKNKSPERSGLIRPGIFYLHLFPFSEVFLSIDAKTPGFPTNNSL